jgi:hypothetical protein
MVKRRDFVKGVSAVAASQLSPGVAFAAKLPAAGTSEAAETAIAGFVPPPPDGLRGNHNYYFYNDGNPITDLALEINFTEDFVAQAGFSIQLNGWSPSNARSTWQQYNYGFYTEDRAKPQISWSIENWPSTEYLDHLHATIGLRKPSDLFNIHGRRVAVPGPGFKVPAGYKFKIGLVHDPKDASGAIIGADFSVLDNHGKVLIKERPLIQSYTFSHTNIPIAAAALAPIITLQLNICARAGSIYGFMDSGAGTITYSATRPLTVLSRHPAGMAAPNIVTAESANTVYGELAAGPARQFTQTVDTIKAPAFRRGGPFAVSRRFDANQTDLFVVSIKGQLNVFSVDGAGRWKKSPGYGPINMAQPSTAIAATKRFGADQQTGVFLVDQHGQLQAFWVSATGVNGPVAIGAKGFARKGAPLAASQQFGAGDQTDVFVFDTNGQLHVFWARGSGDLNGPVKIGPEKFAPNGAQLAASRHFGTRQTDVFVVDTSGTLSRFWVAPSGGWQGPEKISEADFAKPGGGVVAGQSVGDPNHTQVFLVDKRGQLTVFSDAGKGSWSGPVPIGPPGCADPGAAIAVSKRPGGGQTDVFVIDKKGTLLVLSADATGTWGEPRPIGQPGASPSGACVAASPQFGVMDRTDVFVINDRDKAWGWPAVSWVDEKNVWVGPKALAIDV